MIGVIMASKNIKPRNQQDVPDSALSVANMLEGKVLEYKSDFLKQGKTSKEFKKFDGFFKALDEKAEMAKLLVLVDGYESFFKSLPTTPEQEFLGQINSMITKMKEKDIHIEKTNLPPVGRDNDSVSELTDEEKKGEENG